MPRITHPLKLRPLIRIDCGHEKDAIGSDARRRDKRDRELLRRVQYVLQTVRHRPGLPRQIFGKRLILIPPHPPGVDVIIRAFVQREEVNDIGGRNAENVRTDILDVHTFQQQTPIAHGRKITTHVREFKGRLAIFAHERICVVLQQGVHDNV